MNTVFMLMALYDAQVVIGLDRLRADFFSHLTTDKLRMKIEVGEINLPLMKLDGARKASHGVHLMDLAAYLDDMRDKARADYAQIKRVPLQDSSTLHVEEASPAVSLRNESPSDFIKIHEVKRLTDTGTSSIYKLIKAGDFPQQVKIGGLAVAWVRGDILAWCQQRVDASRDSGC